MHRSGHIVLKDAADTLRDFVKSHATGVRGISVEQVTLQIRISLWFLLLQIFGVA